ncbi:MAG TPA: aminoglycoside phosphotransferase family protein [Thermoplasmataceae archaeon]|nr:aminoglycoside phosphotransferase family protein [Thermoplasmatales archaeon AK]HLH86293.1 aminoglycoside phosphotransferase family protein [Thermoplasmataceae archaeon]
MFKKYEATLMKLLEPHKIAKVEEISIGWNSLVFMVDDRYIVKIPRSAESSGQLEKEIEVLKIIERSISVEVPKYFAVARDRLITGAAYKAINGCLLTRQKFERPVCTIDPVTQLTETEQNSISAQLGELLGKIHSLNDSALKSRLSKFGDDDWRNYIIRLIQSLLEPLSKVFTASEVEKAVSFLLRLRDEMLTFHIEGRFIHGDFGGWNIIIDPEKRMIRGVIDWSNSRIGDPAWDFTELVYDFGWEMAEKSIANYPFDMGKDFRRRVDTYLLLSGFLDIEYGYRTGNQKMIEKGKGEVLGHSEVFY